MHQPGKEKSKLFAIVVSDEVEWLRVVLPVSHEETEHEFDIVLVP